MQEKTRDELVQEMMEKVSGAEYMQEVATPGVVVKVQDQDKK